jgi:hypothetical protein
MGAYLPVIILVAMILGSLGAVVAIGAITWALFRRRPRE